uniref:Exophilin 5 n=1 Tax=Panagrolaimus superbus TaxID=310955 RepID=A0A914YQI0_9BILA
MLNNFSHELQNSIKPNQQQFGEVDNYQSYSTFQQYPTTPLPTAISSKHSSAIPPIPPVRTSSLKQQSIQHQNRSKTSSDYSVETRQATFENPSFCSNNENSQKTSKNIVVSDSIDSGGAPSNAKYNFKQQIIKDKNLPIENQLEPNDPPAFHKYFRIYPAINLHKNSYHSKISNLDKNGNEKNFNSTTSFSGKRPQRGGFSCTVNDQIKHYPSPKNGRNYLQSKNNQQLDACSKKSESRSQIISSPEEIGNIIIKNDNAEIKIMGGKVLSQYE